MPCGIRGEGQRSAKTKKKISRYDFIAALGFDTPKKDTAYIKQCPFSLWKARLAAKRMKGYFQITWPFETVNVYLAWQEWA